MRMLAAISAVAVAVMLSACTGGAASRKIAGDSDSLCGVLGARIDDLRRCDTLSAAQSLATFSTYTTFISNSVHDTVDLATANALRGYFEAGQQLRMALVQRRKLVSTAELACRQLGKLSRDANAGSIPLKQLTEFADNEHRVAHQIADSAQVLALRFTVLQSNITKSADQVSAIIRIRNNGVLPQIVPYH